MNKQGFMSHSMPRVLSAGSPMWQYKHLNIDNVSLPNLLLKGPILALCLQPSAMIQHTCYLKFCWIFFRKTKETMRCERSGAHTWLEGVLASLGKKKKWICALCDIKTKKTIKISVNEIVSASLLVENGRRVSCKGRGFPFIFPQRRLVQYGQTFNDSGTYAIRV